MPSLTLRRQLPEDRMSLHEDVNVLRAAMLKKARKAEKKPPDDPDDGSAGSFARVG